MQMNYRAIDPVSSWEVSLMESYTAALDHALKVHCHGWPKDDGELNQSEGVRHVIRLAAAGIICFLESNPDFPELVKQQTINRQVQLPSADAVYHYARLNGRNSYRIRGNRGSAHLFQISVWEGSCSNLRNYKLIDKQDSDTSAYLAPNLDIDIVLSRKCRTGNWMQLPEGDCEIFIRQYYGDWDRECPAFLTIEREGAIYPPSPLSRQEITERLGMVNDWLIAQSAYFKKSLQFHLSTNPDELPTLAIPEAFQDNVYLNGHYRCEANEAVILEVIPPKAVYWGFQLANLQWEQMEFHMRQTSLNSHQAVIDDDGMLRIVLSQKDPGVFNWFDTSGRKLGLLSGRYYKPQGVPIPKLKRVLLADLAAHLPASTRRVSSAERQEAIRRRWASAFRRLCGDQ
jgi:hypothetical protein